MSKSKTPQNLVLEVLREIRDELKSTNTRIDATNQRLDATNQRLDTTNQRLDTVVARLEGVEGGLLDLAQQQRFVVRHLRASSVRDQRFDADLAELRARVEVLESRDPR